MTVNPNFKATLVLKNDVTVLQTTNRKWLAYVAYWTVSSLTTFIHLQYHFSDFSGLW